ncbi:hypothetical protein BC332_33088 [Capsicum chinense]|nr:hypothetical protein BC332_33088 [Capsicum chinense]
MFESNCQNNSSNNDYPTVNSGSFKRSQLIQSSDLREMISPQLPPNPIGNIISLFSSRIYDKKEELKLSKLVADIKKSTINLTTRNNVEENELAIEMLDTYRTGELIFQKRKCHVYFYTSLCKFPLLQDLDFGFGKPIRASMAKGPYKNIIFLMRTYDGGIEALVNLNEEEMCVFEHGKQLLEFGTPIGHDIYYEEEQQYA